jgi:hypothetical protein
VSRWVILGRSVQMGKPRSGVSRWVILGRIVQMGKPRCIWVRPGRSDQMGNSGWSVQMGKPGNECSDR